jgi:hypothetical protein
MTILPGATAAAPVPTTLTLGCDSRRVVVTVQTGTTLSALCLVVGTELVLNLAKQTPGGNRWSGPPSLSGKGVFVESFSGAVDGRYTAHFQAAAPGRVEVIAESNAACTFSVPTPCSLPVSVTTIDVRVMIIKSAPAPKDRSRSP